MNNLSEAEIKRRMVEWRNLKVLHEKAATKRDKLQEENKRLKSEKIAQAEKIKNLQTQVIEQKLQIEELQEIIFGRGGKGGPGAGPSADKRKALRAKRKKKKRGKSSYKRSLPKQEEVTNVKTFELPEACEDCATNFKKKEVVTFYEEDIPVLEQKKEVTECKVEKAYCSKCRNWKRAHQIPSSKVILGRQVKIFIVYQNILMRMSFRQIREYLLEIYRFSISDGEIANILHEMADELGIEYEILKKRLQSSKAVHMDETSWMEHFLWVMTDAFSDDTLYLARRSRGKGNAEELIGKDFKGVGITDAYAVYNLLFELWQLCWAHPHRKLRDLAKSRVLEEEKHKHCVESYNEFSKIYSLLRKKIEQPLGERKGSKRLVQRMQRWSNANNKDPKKLAKIRTQFREREDAWFTCLYMEEIPSDNNKAERQLRHCVLKRKNSYGNRSEKGARSFEVLTSILMSYRNRFQGAFLQNLHDLCYENLDPLKITPNLA
jgi:transposase